MSVKRPPRRYIGLRFEPARATRREVGSAVEAAWSASPSAQSGPAPRLLVCEAGAAIVLVARGEESRAREAFEATLEGPLRLLPVVTSGTIASVKKRLRVPPSKPGKPAPSRP